MPTIVLNTDYERFELFKRKKTGSIWIGLFQHIDTEQRFQYTTGHQHKDSALYALERHIKAKQRKDNGGVKRFDAAFLEYLAIKKKILRESTMQVYTMDFESVYKPHFGKMYVDQIDYADVERFIANLAGKKRSARTQRKHLTALRSFFKNAKKKKYFSGDDPTDGVSVLSGPKVEGIAISFDDAKKLLFASQREALVSIETPTRGVRVQKFSPDAYLYRAILISLYSGLRKSNVLGLTWRYVDLEKRTIEIVWEKYKTRRRFTCPIHSVLLREMRSWRNELGRVDLDALVLGQRIQFPRRSFSSAVSVAGLERMRWHDLRHSFGSWVEKKAPWSVYRDLMGHSAGKRGVSGEYAHSTWEERVEALETLPDLTRGITGEGKEARHG